MSISITSPYAVGQDPRLNKVLERAKDIEKCIKDLESKAKHLESIDSAGSDGFFEEFEEAIEKLLKDLVLDLRSARSSTSDKLSWLRLPPDYITDHTDFLGQLYCTLKLSEQIHEENCQIENAHLGLLPPPLEQLSSQDNDYLKTPRTDTETLSNQLLGRYQQDDRHRKAISPVIQDLADFSKAFKFYHFRLRNYVEELRDQQAEQPDLLDSTSLASEKLMERLYPPTLNPLKGSSRQESCPAQREYLACSLSDEVGPRAEQGKEGLKRKRATKEERSERGLKGKSTGLILKSY